MLDLLAVFLASTTPIAILPPALITLGGRDARKAVDAMLDVITENLTKNEPVVFTGFGKFEVRARRAAKQMNPQTGKKINVAAKVVPAFKAGKSLKAVIVKKLKVVQAGSKLKVKKA